MIERVSQHETSATVLIEEHYAALGLDKGWSDQRVVRLCQVLHVTPHELGKLCCIEFDLMSKMLKRKHFPPHIALHFAVIENWYFQASTGKLQKPVVPIDLLAEP